jgi:hypothetical protein
VDQQHRDGQSESRTASCHCGNIRILIPELPHSLSSCNCSVCRRYGALWAYFTRRQVTLDADEKALAAYRWGDRTIDFWHCANCGCLTHYTSREDGPESRFAVNARMLPPDLIESLPVRRFDGADTWRYLD